MKRGFTYLLILCLLNSIVIAQDAKIFYLKDAPAPIITKAKQPRTSYFEQNIAQGKYLFNTFDTENGLPLDAIGWGHNSSICDRKGNIWFVTLGGGVTKFDGAKFTTYNTLHGLAGNSVACMTEDSNGNLWFGTIGDGVSKFDGVSFTNYSTKDGLVSDRILSIAEDKNGDIWFGSWGNGASKFNGKSFTNYTVEDGLASNVVECILTDFNGITWFGTSKGLNKLENNIFRTFSVEDGLSSNHIECIVEDEEGVLWLGTTKGVSYYNGQFSTLKLSTPYNTEHIFSIMKDKSGALWLGTWNHGLIMYENDSLTIFGFEQGIPENRVVSIVEDQGNNIWIGTWEGGVSRLQGTYLKSYNTSHGLADNIVRSVYEDKDGNLWFGTEKMGVSKYNRKSFTNYSTQQGMSDNPVLDIYQDETGNMWFVNDRSGLIQFNGTEFKSYSAKQGLAGNEALFVKGDTKNNIWIGVYGGGVSKFDGESFTNYNTTHGLPNNIVNDFIEDNNKVFWFATEGGGISKFNGKSFINFTIDDGLAHNVVRDIFKDKSGNLWFSTYGGGLSILSQEKLSNNKTEFINLDKSNGLPDNNVNVIIEDKLGNIIVGTNFGIGIIRDGKIENGIKIYNQFTGFPIKRVYDLLSDKNNIIWIGTGNIKAPLIKFDYEKIQNRVKPISVNIENIRLKGKLLSWYNLLNNSDSAVQLQLESQTYGHSLTETERVTLKEEFSNVKIEGISSFQHLPEKLVLPFKHNALTFEYSAIETGNHSLVNYQYMLKGMETEWNPITKKTDATYNNLTEGDYTFIIKAQSPWGNWSPTTEFKFKVLPPWYRTWWAFIIYGVISISVIVLIVRFNASWLVSKNERLEKIIRDRTKEIIQQKEELENQAKELKGSNEKLVALDKFKENMTGMIVHDLKNPLNAIISLTEHDFKIEYKALMNQYGKSMLNLVTNILEVQKFEKAEVILTMEAKKLISIVESAIAEVSLLIKDKNHKVHLNIKGTLWVKIDATLIKRVFVNLLTNAIKYTPVNGEITISSKVVNSSLVEVSVKDTGTGISEQDTALIFDKFKQLNSKNSGKTRSTGLGLTFCKMAIEAHECEIHVNSQIDIGTEFTFTLPYCSYEVIENTKHAQNEGIKDLFDNASFDIKKLTHEEKEFISNPLLQIKKHEVYDVSAVRNILKEIQSDSLTITEWSEALEQTLYTSNEKEFIYLTSI